MRRSSLTTRSILLTLACAAVAASACAAEPCPLVPTPKSYRSLGQSWTLTGADQAAIVLGAQATAPEHYAAQCLQTHIERRFQQRLPILAETAVPPSAQQVILLGQRSTNAWIDRLCQARNIDLGPTAPGPDGFVIEMLEDGPRQVILLGASNPRAAIYAQDTLFDLLRSVGDRVEIPLVAVRDWPSIAWRGRPHSVLHHHLVPGAMDAYLRSRINFTDVRDDPDVKAGLFLPPRKASMGFPPGKPIDRAPVKQVIDEAHRRGLFVYGTVSAAVEENRFDAVIRTFEELLALGVDGLWISFDDTGAGANPTKIIGRTLELGRRHGMTDNQIAITPPAGDYQYIDRPFNATCAKVPGMEQAQWLFTRVPCQADVLTARAQGIQRLPGWWHNLVGIRGGFLHNDNVVCTLRADDRPAYVDMQPLSRGWHAPQYDQLRDAPQHTQCVLLWGVVNGWPEEYEVGALGLWAWEPAKHDWDQVRRSVYAYVYGPAQVPLAWDFDNRFAELKTLFDLPAHRFEPNKGFPGRLKKVADRAQALAAIDELQSLAERLAQRSPQQTAIDPARLESVYLEPMRASLVYARKMAALDYPEYTLSQLEGRMFRLLEAGDEQAAQQTLAAIRPQVQQQLARIESELQGLKGLAGYLTFWRQRIAGIETWQRAIQDEQTKRAARLAALLQADPAKLFPYKPQATAADLEALFRALDKPPAEKPLLEIRAADWLAKPPRLQGQYAAGPYHFHEQQLVAIAYPGNVASEAGDYGQVTAELQVPPHQGRLLLEAFVNDTRLDNRWRGYRFLQLWAGEQLLWEEDIASDRTGREWVRVALPTAKPGDRLALRFRVVEKRPVSSHLSVAFLGPVRLRADDESK